MSYFDNSAWPAPGRQPSWEAQAPPSRSGASSAVARDEPTAFLSQIEEVDRAADNLMKSGKMQMFGMGAGGPSGHRGSMPYTPGRQFGGEFGGDPRMGGGPSRHHSVSDFEGGRPGSASSVQGFYANQRYGPRRSEADEMMQAKRRMAAQRERELRNYHQEQQYNRSAQTNASAGKSDRSMSPAGMSEEERRELIARQHRALYGNESNLYSGDGTSRPQQSQDARVTSSMSGGRGPSPLAFDPFGNQLQQNPDSAVQMPSREGMSGKEAPHGQQRSRANSTSSPSSNPNASSFSLFDNQQSSRTSTSSPGGSPPRQGQKPSSGAGVAPIGTRPQGQSQNAATAAMNKQGRTTPLPSPLSYGFSASDQQSNGNNNHNNNSSTSNAPSSAVESKVGLGGWGSSSGVWGSQSKNLGVQASVWG